ncbi:ClpX C4-type zinc finger protein [Rhizobium leguminosarum bv. trifolii WSM597]|uniref:ClpX C4-type zinc finger protein n=1 Tax=Rhizobium leguminosarum bv. trifolii WSM597 TaxID=754764 RepID=I9N8B4_RHILT|nr:ClpX C4-type zinc finger protein [Rhizobium leguminosarum]EJB02942.1 ClpX C4-type zinc finger protein [Rhizobium leguminosarum bv. trifolii WSM597]
MAEFASSIDASPTDVFQDPACSFCGTSAGKCRVLIANSLRTAFVCEICAPIIASQVRDTIAQQDLQNGRKI